MTQYRDTPFEREHIANMPFASVQELVKQLRDRRLAQQRIYEEALAAKAKMKEEQLIERYKKVMLMIEKRVAAADKALTALDKYLAEVQVLRLQVGDNPWIK